MLAFVKFYFSQSSSEERLTVHQEQVHLGQLQS